MASVVPNLSMSEVRRCLQEIRRCWDRHTPWSPFNPSQHLSISTEQTPLSFTKFTWMFVSGHHTHRKRQRADRGSAAE